MSRVRISTALVAALMLAVMLFGFGVSAFAADAGTSGYDYSHLSSESNVTVSSAELLKAYLGTDLDAKEKAFLDSFTNITLTYNDIITTDRVSVSDAAPGVKVAASEYSYPTVGNKDFVWLPVSATLGGVTKQLVNGECTFDTPYAESLSVTVRYESEVIISAADINSVINIYFDTCRYSADMADYAAKLKLYNDYVIAKRLYDSALAKYNKYLGELQEYKSALLEYNSYEERLQKYNTDYKNYLDYLDAEESYEANFAKYQTYLAEMEKVKKQLSAVELVKVPMTDGRTLFAAVNGGTVDQALDSIGEIVKKLGVDRDVVEKARMATNKVRELMNTYYSYETERERYAYYTQNYNDFCTYFLLLTQCLDKLYENSMVKLAMNVLSSEGDDKKRKYIILVAQLALVSNALIDGGLKNYGDKAVAYNSTWKIDGKTIKSILENKEYFNDDDTSAPLATGYPSQISEPIKPDTVTEPVFPVKPSQPIEPVTVSNPGDAPETVIAPDVPVASNERVKAIYDGMDTDSRAALASADPEQRPYASNAYRHTLVTETVKTVGKEQVTVNFVSEEGELLYTVTVDSGTRILYDGELPADYFENAEGTFELDGWMISGDSSENPERFDLTKPITESVTLQPKYKRQPAYYNVTWVINGTEYTERLISGEIPTCPYATEIPETANTYFVFTGWDKPVTELLEDVRYEAKFDEKYIFPYDKGLGAILTDDGETVTADATKSGYSSVTLYLSELLERIAGSRALTVKTRFGVLSLDFTEVIALKEANADKLTISCSTNGSTLYNYTSSLGDKDGKPCDIAVDMSVVLPAKLKNLASSVLYGEDGVSKIRHTISDNTISFTMATGKTYKLVEEHHIYTVPSDMATVTLSKSLASPGERVRITVDLREGVELIRIIVTDAEGKEIKVASNGTIAVGNSDIRVAVQAKYKTYTVTFIADGKTVSQAEVTHGGKITVPATPKKGNDEKYSYTFKGWSPEVPEFALSDMTFTAEFESTELPEDNQGTSDLAQKIDTAMDAATIAAVAVIGLGLLIVIILIIKKIRG